MKHKTTFNIFVFLLLIFNLLLSSALADDENISDNEKLSITAKKNFSSGELLKFSIV